MRIGLPPKRAIVMRTNLPFKKIIRTLVAQPNRVITPHKIEMLGDGQQVAVAGNHPDTGAPYTWQVDDRRSTRCASAGAACQG